jgi:hypothetical protein
MQADRRDDRPVIVRSGVAIGSRGKGKDRLRLRHASIVAYSPA